MKVKGDIVINYKDLMKEITNDQNSEKIIGK